MITFSFFPIYLILFVFAMLCIHKHRKLPSRENCKKIQNPKVKRGIKRARRKYLFIILICVLFTIVLFSLSTIIKEILAIHIIRNDIQQNSEWSDPQDYAISANTASEDVPLSEKVEQLMNDLLYSSDFPSCIEAGYITEKALESCGSIARIHFFSSSSSDEEKNTDAPDLLQEATDAEDKAKEISAETTPNLIELLNQAVISIGKFESCLNLADMANETKSDIRMRIGILYYNIYQNAEELDDYDPNYRTYLLCMANQIFLQLYGNMDQSVDDYAIQSHFYLGETNLEVGNNHKDNSQKYYSDALRQLNEYLQKEKESDTTKGLIDAAKSDISTLKQLTE